MVKLVVIAKSLLLVSSSAFAHLNSHPNILEAKINACAGVRKKQRKILFIALVFSLFCLCVWVKNVNKPLVVMILEVTKDLLKKMV